jgi:ribosome-associated heat shock protein Hsp15
MSEPLRLDKYLWAIRIFKTRSQATDAIQSGKVKFNDSTVKPAKHVSIGDTYEIKTEARKWIILVTGLLYKRVQYSEAIQYYTDLTPAEVTEPKQKSSFVEYTGKRQSKQGRPTKKNRREMNNWLD